MERYAYAGPAVPGGGNSWQSNFNAYHQQMQAARQPQYGQGGNQVAQPLSAPAYSGYGPRPTSQLGGQYAMQSQPMAGRGTPTIGYGSSQQMVTPGGGGGIPGARFGQIGAEFNPQVNQGINYEYKNPQTGQSYNLNRMANVFQQGAALNGLTNYINAMRQQQLQQSGGLGGLMNTNTPGFYGV